MPLAHILAPLIARKAQEIEADLGHNPTGYLDKPQPELPPVSLQTKLAGIGADASRTSGYSPEALGAGYLQRPAPGGAAAQGTFGSMMSAGANPGQVNVTQGAKAAEQAKVNADYAKRLAAAKQKAKMPSGDYDPRLQSDRFNQGVDALKREQSKDPKERAQARKDYQRLNLGDITPMPNANAPTGEPVAYDELGRPVYDTPAPAKPAPKKGRVVIQVKPGDVTDEAGYAVDKRGKRLGYIDQETSGTRYLDRRPQDLNLDQTAGNIIRDSFARKQLEHQYGPHMKAMEENRDERGMPTDKLPEGYINPATKRPFTTEERKNIMSGIKKLREVQKLEAEGGGGRA